MKITFLEKKYFKNVRKNILRFDCKRRCKDGSDKNLLKT